MIIFSILITTKDRLNELKITLAKIESLISNENVQCLICDDDSTDGTYEYVKNNFPEIILIKNEKSLGLIGSRNRLLNLTTANFAISIDDDAHMIAERPLLKIKDYFENNPKCGVIAFRIFWGNQPPFNCETVEKSTRVKSFVGCGHVWNMKAWRDIPDYPEWFVFYGEEEFASYQLFKKGWEVHYLPEILVHHRVDIKERKLEKDYGLRLRRSLRSGWFNYFLFLPWSKVIRLFLYTLYIQMKSKVFKGDMKATLAIIKAIVDLVYVSPFLIIRSNRLSSREFRDFQKLEETKIYWQPANKING